MEVHSTTWSTVGLGLGFWDEVMGTGKMYEYPGTHRTVGVSAQQRVYLESGGL